MLAFAAAVTGFLAFNKFVSPQYLVWLIPLVLLLPGRTGLVATGLVAASLVLAQIWFFHYSRVFELERITWLVVARDAALLALYVLLLSPLEDEHAVLGEDEPPVRAPPEPGEIGCGRQRVPAVRVAGLRLVGRDPLGALYVGEAEEPAPRREMRAE